MLTTRHRHTLLAATAASCLALFLASSGCALPHLRAPSNALNDAALNSELQALLCRVEPSCADIRLHVTSSKSAQAEMFPDGRLLINIGLLVATHDEAEIAFVLAHESAHRRLKHQFARTPERRAEQEIAADAGAREALTAAGFDASAGLSLLQRLLDQAQAEKNQPEAASSSSDSPAPELANESMIQVMSRVAALKTAGAAIITAPAHASDGIDWQALLAPYQLNATDE